MKKRYEEQVELKALTVCTRNHYQEHVTKHNIERILKANWHPNPLSSSLRMTLELHQPLSLFLSPQKLPLFTHHKHS